MLSPTGLIPWFSKTEGNTYATLLHHPFLFKGKPTHAQEVARRISGAIAGEVAPSQVKIRLQQRVISGAITKYPSQTLIPRITLFAICLSFSSPPLLPCRLIRLFSVHLFPVCLSFTMAESKRGKGSLPSSSTFDNPSILSKLIKNDAIERPTEVINENLNNFDEDDSGIFRYLLDESLKDAWDRLLRIRASYVPQYQIEVYLKSFYVGLPASFKQVLDSILKRVFLKGNP